MRNKQKDCMQLNILPHFIKEKRFTDIKSTRNKIEERQVKSENVNVRPRMPVSFSTALKIDQF